MDKNSNVDKAWLVRNRSEIQWRMLWLYQLHDFPTPDRDIWAIYGVLIGVVFSLWRAVFLIQTTRDIKVEIEHGRKVLGILIETNAIGFPQDVATSQWSSGYYVNNAALRLAGLSEMPSAQLALKSETTEWLEHHLSPFDVDMMSLVQVKLSEQWEKALKGYDMVFEDFKTWLAAQE